MDEHAKRSVNGIKRAFKTATKHLAILGDEFDKLSVQNAKLIEVLNERNIEIRGLRKKIKQLGGF